MPRDAGRVARGSPFGSYAVAWLVQMGYYRAGWNTDPSWWDRLVDEYLKALVRKEAEESSMGHRGIVGGDPL